MESNHISKDSTLQELSNGTKNTQIRVRMTKLWPYEVGAKRGDCSNVATSRTNLDVTETEHPDVATLLHDVTTFGVGFGWIFSPF